MDSNGFLKEINERTDIHKDGNIVCFTENNIRNELVGDEIVSMNLMGFTSKVFEEITEGFDTFYKASNGNLKAEYYIPNVMTSIIKKGIKVPVLKTNNTWFGVTYKEDKPIVQATLSKLVNQGFYPIKLW